jgi:hypothetical protein
MSKRSADIINLADVASNPLRATNLKNDLTDTASSLVLLQLYAAQSAQQPTLDPLAIGKDGSDLLPLLAAHQETAKRNAQAILASVSPAVVAVLTDILGFGSMLDTFTDSILPLLPSITTNEAARQQVLALIGQIEIAAAARDGNARQVATQLSQAVANAQSDNANFAADVEQANKVIGSDSGALAQIQSQIEDTRRAISSEIAGVVVSALITAGGGVMIGVGALATLPAGVAGSDIVLAGVGVLVTGVSALATSAAMLANDNGKLAGLYQESARLSVTLTLVRALAGQVNSYFDATSGMTSSLNALTGEWASIRVGIASFRDDVTRAADESDVVHITTALQLARQDWRAVIGQAQQLTTRLVDLAPHDLKKAPSAAA